MRTFVTAVETFFGHLAAIGWGFVALALLCHLAKIVCRTRSWRNILAASYPERPVRWRGVFGAYVAGVGVNAILPARGGDVLKLYLAKRQVPGSTYPTLGSTLLVETLFDVFAASALLLWAVSLGVLPGLDALPTVPFEWAWVARHPWWSLAVLVAVVLALSLLWIRASHHVVAFKERVAQGFAILRNPLLYVRRVVTWQLLDWCFRLATIYFFLRAFGLAGNLHNAFLVQVTQSVATMLPLTPGGLGTEQGLLLYVFAGRFSTSSVLAFSVGMKLIVIAFNVALGFAAIAIMMRTLRWRRVVDEENVRGRGVPAPDAPLKSRAS